MAARAERKIDPKYGPLIGAGWERHANDTIRATAMISPMIYFIR